MRLWAAVLCLCLCSAPRARADDRPSALVVFVGEGGNRTQRERMEAHVARAARQAGYRVIEEAAISTESLGGVVRPERLAGIAEIERLLTQARISASMLDERAALSALHRAARIAEAHADVPGSAAWLAEIEVAFGLVAAQIGRDELADAALARAAFLDPTRSIRAAEASPEVVERAHALAVEPRPIGRFEVRSSVPGAIVYLDDAEVGPVPTIVRAPVGRHVLRLEAPAHLGYGRVIDVLEGNRAAMDITLSEDPAVAAARELDEAARAMALPGVAAALRTLEREQVPIVAAWIVEIGPSERAVFVPCVAGGCGEPQRIDDERAPRTAVVAGASPRSLARARAWAHEPIGSAIGGPTDTAWYERWYVWAIAGAVIASGVTSAVLISQPEPRRGLSVSVDFGDIADAMP